MCTSIKIYTALSVLAILGSTTYRVSKLLIKQLTNQNHLTSFEYQYLGESKQNKFDNWKTNYSLFKRHLIKNISIFKEVKDEINGGYLLKNWCSERINKSLDKEDFKLIKKYCVVNLKNVVLDKPNLKAIDDLKQSERKKYFTKNTYNKEINELFNWCHANFKLAHIPKNQGILEKIKSCCVVNIQVA